MVRGKFSMKNTRISLDAYKIEYIRRFGIRKITAQGEVVYPRTISLESVFLDVQLIGEIELICQLV